MSLEPQSQYVFADFTLAPDERQLLRSGVALSLSPTSFDLLMLLVERAEQLIENHEIWKKIWGNTALESNNLTVRVSEIRRVLSDKTVPRKFIETVPGYGYRFCHPVKVLVPDNGESQSNSVESRNDDSLTLPYMVTVPELLSRGWTVDSIIRQTMQLDYETLAGLIPEHEGEHAQWMSVVEDHPETVRLLLNHYEKVVGYWHIIPLFPEEFAKLKLGDLQTNEITSDVICMMELPGLYDVYFCILTIATRHRRTANIRTLFESFIDAVEYFARSGIFFREICIDAYTPMGVAICKSFGMTKLIEHPDRGTIYTRRFFPFPDHSLFSQRDDLTRLYTEEFARFDFLHETSS